ncbi:hypothetical protein ACQPZJ_35560 [Actinoplanes sp. CA-054009]
MSDPQSVTDGISALLVDYLGTRGILATEARFGDSTDTYTSRYGGCETCGPDYETEMDFSIIYTEGTTQYERYHSVDGDPMNFLASLLRGDAGQ